MQKKEQKESQKESLRNAVRDLLRSQRLAVLATNRGGHPYSSLVAFASTDDLCSLLFATARATRKYENIKADRRVSLLVDNRANKAEDFRETVAVSIFGYAEEIKEEERNSCLPLYLGKHPYLEEFVNAPTCALFKVKITKFSVVTRFQNVIELQVME